MTALITCALLAVVGCGQPEIHQNTMMQDEVHRTPKYLVQHYYDDPADPAGGFAVQREADSNGAFRLIYFDANDPDTELFRLSYDPNGAPTEGLDEGIRNPSKLWFWRVQPEVGSVIIVRRLLRSFDGELDNESDDEQGDGSSIVELPIRIKYERDEVLWVDRDLVLCHVVSETPMQGGNHSRDIYWLDEQGMPMRSVHIVGSATRTSITTRTIDAGTSQRPRVHP